MSKPTGKPPSASAPSDPTNPPNLAFEEALAQIESIIDRIEAGEVGLEESLKEYERGVSLVSLCRARLDKAQQQVDDLTRRLEQADDGGPSGAVPDSSPDDPDR